MSELYYLTGGKMSINRFSICEHNAEICITVLNNGITYEYNYTFQGMVRFCFADSNTFEWDYIDVASFDIWFEKHNDEQYYRLDAELWSSKSHLTIIAREVYENGKIFSVREGEG